MPYDPSADEIRRLREEVHRLRLNHIDLKGRIGLVVIFGLAAIYWIGLVIYLVYERLSENCGCG